VYDVDVVHPEPPRPAHDPVDVSDFMDKPPTVGDVINSLDPVNVPEHAAIMAEPPTVGDVEMFGPDDPYDPSDDVKECPNCGSARVRDYPNDPEHEHWECIECRYVWPSNPEVL
jgi:hypothetical protein